jgi:hypothetical protein
MKEETEVVRKKEKNTREEIQLHLRKALRCNTLPAKVGGETRAGCLVTTRVQLTYQPYFGAFQTMVNPYLSLLSSQTSGSVFFWFPRFRTRTLKLAYKAIAVYLNSLYQSLGVL